MAYTLISTVTVGAGGAASIDFTSIPQTYTDLLLVVSLITGGTNSVLLKINGATTTFTTKSIEGNGSTASSWSRTNEFGGYNSTTASAFSSINAYFPNYASTNANKVYSLESVAPVNGATEYDDVISGLWASNAAITSFSIYNASASSWSQYSTASLYGIN